MTANNANKATNNVLFISFGAEALRRVVLRVSVELPYIRIMPKPLIYCISVCVFLPKQHMFYVGSLPYCNHNQRQN